MLHILPAIALLLTFNPHWGQQSWGWGTRWCSSFSSEAISSNIYSVIYTAAGWKTCTSLFWIGGQRRGLCVEKPRLYLWLTEYSITSVIQFSPFLKLWIFFFLFQNEQWFSTQNMNSLTCQDLLIRVLRAAMRLAISISMGNGNLQR